MAKNASFSLEERNHKFLNEVAGDNKSFYINKLLDQERKKNLEKKILLANQQEAEDLDYQRALGDWDTTLIDGLSNNEL